MNLLIDINHPSQVHLFKNAIWEWERHGHKVLIVARNKDITLQLLEGYKFNYVPGTVRNPSLPGLLAELFQKTALIYRIGQEFKPDVLMSLGSPPAAWAAKLLKREHIAFTDTEHSREQLFLYKPFSIRIYTPENFLLNVGLRQYRYSGYHELAYLHPNRFQPNPENVRKLGLDPGETFSIVRLVSFQATHDVARRGLAQKDLDRILSELSRFGKVLVSSERSKGLTILGEESRTLSPMYMHDLLAYASFFIGEGTTMATESALLGTPAITTTPHVTGNRKELQERYDLIYALQDTDEIVQKIQIILETPDVKSEWARKRERLFADKIDVTAYMVAEIEQYLLELQHTEGRNLDA